MTRRGFTLVELLVSMTIIIILVGITAAAVMVSANGDRIPGAARQTQSMILGARDRAIYAGEPRGVRLISDPDNAALVTSFVFVGAPQAYGKNRGSATVRFNVDGDPATEDWWVIEEDADKSGWLRLYQRGVLGGLTRIRFEDEPRWFTVEADSDAATAGNQPFVDFGNGRIGARLSKKYKLIPSPTEYNGLTYSLVLNPTPLPGEEPRLLPRGVVIDLGSSKVPVWWGLSPERRDIMFNERGTAYGPLASSGVLSFHIADIADYARGFRIGHPNAVPTTPPRDVDGDGVHDDREGDERILTFFASSGTISIAPVDDADENSDGVRDDPVRLAETGSEG